jgi:hypothetical protein
MIVDALSTERPPRYKQGVLKICDVIRLDGVTGK